jgi:FtsP/CotA-like multicopper oxidase with cupredoxin domain
VLIGAAVLVAILAFVLLQPEDEDSGQTATQTTTQTTTEETGGATAGETTEPEGATTEEEPPPPETVRIRVEGGQPVGGVEEIEVKKGDTVRLTVTADAPEHVHVHGYDIFKDVGPGRAARFRFKADVEGVFEIELEDSHRQIAELRVEP